MIRKKEERVIETRNIRGGIGEVTSYKILNNAEEMHGKGRMFSLMVIEPGNSIGLHQHVGDNEIFYILSGEGIYNDNGNQQQVFPGDTLICSDGESHSLMNSGTAPLEMIALILYS